jgi:hypothetical protein
MRVLLHALSVVAVIALGFWAYEEGYDTRAAEREVRELRKEIGRRHEELSVLRAEWAYLNRPDRLYDLAEMNFERLGLMPLAPVHFATIAEVPYPRPEARWSADSAELAEALRRVRPLDDGPHGPAVIAPPTLAGDGEMLP